ncbi:MAG: hypothetical protein JW832_04975 [Deltaproteobacteria bacterium]|nr:hypothetical protein [Deltaproteobacteria bacterium]
MPKNWALPLCVEQYGVRFRITELDGCAVEDIAGLFLPCLVEDGPKFYDIPEIRFRPHENTFDILAILASLYVRHGLFPMHASGIVMQEQGILCVGPSGTGKSSFARAALAAGLKIVGDDVVLLRCKEGKIELLPWIYSIQEKTEIKQPLFLDPGLFASGVLKAVLFSKIGAASQSSFSRIHASRSLPRLSLQLLWSFNFQEALLQGDLVKQLLTFPSISVLFGKDILKQPDEFFTQLNRALLLAHP